MESSRLSATSSFVSLANQPRFIKKRIAPTTTASITTASTIFANVKFSTSLPYSGSSIRSGCFLSRSGRMTQACNAHRSILLWWFSHRVVLSRDEVKTNPERDVFRPLNADFSMH
jgi:hypothetical protein